MNTCRFCKKMDEEHKYPMIKYGVRHYAHADCALRKQGAEFFNRLTEWQLTQFPAIAAFECGFLDDLQAQVAARPYQQRYKSALGDS